MREPAGTADDELSAKPAATARQPRWFVDAPAHAPRERAAGLLAQSLHLCRRPMRSGMRQNSSAAALGMLVIVTAVLAAAPAIALQPLDAFIAAARERNPDALEARANLAQQDAQADAALGSRLPGVTARATYARNQYQSQIALPGFPTTTLVPTDQWDGSATLSVPLVDLAGFRRLAAAKTNVDAATQPLAATRPQIKSQTGQDSFQPVADRALRP